MCLVRGLSPPLRILAEPGHDQPRFAVPRPSRPRLNLVRGLTSPLGVLALPRLAKPDPAVPLQAAIW